MGAKWEKNESRSPRARYKAKKKDDLALSALFGWLVLLLILI